MAQWVETETMGMKVAMKMDAELMASLGGEVAGLTGGGPPADLTSQDPGKILESSQATYDLKYIGEEAVEGVPLMIFAGSIKDEFKEMMTGAFGGAELGFTLSGIRLVVGRDDGFPRRVEMLGAEGAPPFMRMEYRNVKLNPEIADAEFQYAPPADALVMDMSEMMAGIDLEALAAGANIDELFNEEAFQKQMEQIVEAFAGAGERTAAGGGAAADMEKFAENLMASLFGEPAPAHEIVAPFDAATMAPADEVLRDAFRVFALPGFVGREMNLKGPMMGRRELMRGDFKAEILSMPLEMSVVIDKERRVWSVFKGFDETEVESYDLNDIAHAEWIGQPMGISANRGPLSGSVRAMAELREV
jgi:hypothetical protein